MPEKECLKSENCVYFYLTTAKRAPDRGNGLIKAGNGAFY
jgi:hypothetical protein